MKANVLRIILGAATAIAVGWGGSARAAFSENAVGYYHLNIEAGFNLIANGFNNADNSLSVVFPQVPDGSSLLTWDPGIQAFLDADLYFAGLGWLNSGTGEASTTTLNPGGGAFLNSPQAADLIVLGEVPQGVLGGTVPSGFSIVSQLLPIPLIFCLVSGPGCTPFVPNDGDSILFWNNESQGYAPALLYFGGLGWLDSETGDSVEPVIPLGDAVFYNNAGDPIAFSFDFSVN